MAIAQKIASLTVQNGTARMTLIRGNTPLPAQGDGMGFNQDLAGVDNMVAGIMDLIRSPEFGLALVVLRAHEIDPTHGATFRNAINGTTITYDPTSDNIITIAQ